MQRIIRDKQLYANKINNLEEMDKFLERYNLLWPNQVRILPDWETDQSQVIKLKV